MTPAAITSFDGPAVALVNAVFGLLIAFNIVLTQTQLAAVDGVVNTAFILFAVVWGAVKAAKPTPPA